MTAPFRRLPPAGLLWAALVAWLAASPPAGAQGADGVDAPAGGEAAGKWAYDLLRDIRTRQTIHGFAAGQKLALQPLDPLATGLSDRQRWQVYDWMVDALQKAATPHYTVVNRARVKEIYRAIEQSGSDSRDVMKEFAKVLKKQGEARINIACRSNAFRGGGIVLNCEATDIVDGDDLASGRVAFREDWLPLLPLTRAVNAIAGKVAAKLGGLGAGRIGEIRIVEESAGRETRLSKRAARLLDTGIFEHMERYPGWQGIDAGPKGPVYRLEGELLQFDERKLDLHVRVYRGDSRVHSTREYIDLATVPARLLGRAPAPAGDEPAEAAGEGGAVPAAQGGDDPASLDRAMYTIGMDRAFEAGDHAGVLDYVGRLGALGGGLPSRAEYFRGVALLRTDRPGEAEVSLRRYAAGAGPEGRWYKDAAGLLLEVENSDHAAFARAKASDTPESYAAYLSSYPSGRHRKEASRLKTAAAAREEAARKEAERRAREDEERKRLAREEAERKEAERRARAEAERRAREDKERGRLAREEAARAGEAALGLGYADRVRVQRGLAASGFEIGAADGIFGRRTREVVALWQVRRGLEGTGYLTRDQADALMAAARESEAKKPEAGSAFRDCAECPEMVVVPAGSFRMGSPPSEEGRDDDEGPMRRVTISEPFAVGKYEVTFAEWDACVSAGGCGGHRPGDQGWGRGNRPAVHVSWKDAQAYVAWLSEKTGKSYRLLSESEWEYAARAGTRTSRHWGEGASGQCGYANGADRTAEGRYSGWTVAECDDGHVWTAPVGTFKANGFGLHDVLGNVWEWVADCWNDSYAGAPSDGSVWESGECGRRVLRGGSWGSRPWRLRSANRNWIDAFRNIESGFRVARTLAP